MTTARGGAGSIRVIVLGYLVRGPFGGMAWHHLQYVLGLARLGHDVWFLEDSDVYASCYDPSRNVLDTDPTYGLGFAADAFGRVGLGERWAYHDEHTARWMGPAAARALELCATAELLLDLSGVNPMRPWLERIPARALVDTDPAFTQVRHIVDPARRALAERHTAFFSFGENLGAPGCSIPDDGFRWQPTRQPVVLDAWPVTPGPAAGKFTTVMHWDSYPPLEHEGRRYGMKSASLQPYLDLPAAVDAELEIALGSATAPRALLREKGWTLLDPHEVSSDPWRYQRYLRGSRAEFTVAKQGYVSSRSGWFSERSAAYLASGRPVVTQETGFSDWLRADAGVLPFATPDEARAAIAEVNARYDAHCRSAREVAEAYFDARIVLPSLVERALAPAAPRAAVAASRS